MVLKQIINCKLAAAKILWSSHLKIDVPTFISGFIYYSGALFCLKYVCYFKTCIISDPDGTHATSRVTNNHDGTWKIEFTPSEIGEYFIEVMYANHLVNGSPFKCSVFDPAQIRIVPVNHGVINQPVKFEVDASQAGTGQLEIAIENGRIPCTFSNQGNLRFVGFLYVF